MFIRFNPSQRKTVSYQFRVNISQVMEMGMGMEMGMEMGMGMVGLKLNVAVMVIQFGFEPFLCTVVASSYKEPDMKK